jgi:nucleoside-diphosphate-sugar epimerase
MWSDPDRPEGMNTYNKSKLLAEKAAWEYMDSLPEDEKFELSTINPAFVLGPTNVGGNFSSGSFIGQIMMNKLPSIPKISMPCVDVRNVATAHAVALKTDEAQGKRFLLNADTIWFTFIAETL